MKYPVETCFEPDQIRAMKGGLAQVLTVMAALRDPDRGCPWDLEQNFETIAPYTIEEAYEVREALRQARRNGDWTPFKEELGDLLLQVVYQSQLACEEGLFDFDQVAQAIASKMIKRHPHVFSAEAGRSVEAQTRAWEDTKAEERSRKRKGADASLLDDIVPDLPALTRAEKIQKRAGRVGFDWPDAQGPLHKLQEELAELDKAQTKSNQEEELGDVLFTIANLARKLGLDPEEALRKANDKFELRFRTMEALFHASPESDEGFTLADLKPEFWEILWQRAKQEVKSELNKNK